MRDMSRPELLWTCIILVLPLFTSDLNQSVYSQTTVTNNSSTNGDKSQISASISLHIRNETLQVKIDSLWAAVVGFLNSGPNLLKVSATTDPIVKTIITNIINNTTQTVEGVEATNAVLSVEITRALRTVNSSLGVSSNVVTVDTTSLCNPSGDNSIACQNNVTIE
jgi:hypothetical protein